MKLVSTILLCLISASACLAYSPDSFPGKGDRSHFNLSKNYATTGATLQNKGHFKEAVEAYDKAISIYPYDAWVYSNRGNALSSLGKHSDAIASFKKTIQLEPNWPDGYNNLACEQKNTRDFIGAQANCKIAMQLDPSDPYPVLTMAEIYIDMAKFDSAKALIRKASKMQKAASDQFIQDTIKKDLGKISGSGAR